MRDLLLKNFIRISNIPRESGNEKMIASFFVNVAKKNNLYYYKDKYNNVLIRKKGNINKPSIGIQAHLDMVCIKDENSTHDFKKDPIEVIVDGDVVKAKGTSLGADQGVGLAMMLTLIEDNELYAPDLEFIFTVEEETNFNGADTFPYHLLTTKQIINLDSCNDNVVYIGSEADISNEYIYNFHYIETNLPTYKIEINTNCGGNSGEYIEESKNNAIYKAFEILENRNVHIISVFGGINEDDIANNCIIEFATDENISDIDYKIVKIDKKYAINFNDSQELIKNILLMKSGFIGNSGISANLGYIETTDKQIRFYYLMRSKDEKTLSNYNNYLYFQTKKLTCNEMYSDNCFINKRDSKLLKKYKSLYKEIYKEDVVEEICTGGIECAVISNKIADLDIISIGSNVNYFHTTVEETYISSWEKIYKILLNLLLTN